MPMIQLDGKDIFYQIREADNKNALIFIHGSAGSSECWKNQLTLEIEYNLIAIDLPSHAKSEKFTELSLELYVNTVKALIESLSFDKIILAGHSLGGAVAQAYYFKYPEKVEALILVGTGARLRVSPMILEALKNDFQAYIDSIPVGAFYRKTDKDIIDHYLEDVKKIEPEVALADFSICDKFDELKRVKDGEIKVPSLVLCGNADKLTPVKYSQFFLECIEESEFKLIRNAGHMLFLEKPEEINEAIVEFVKNL